MASPINPAHRFGPVAGVIVALVLTSAAPVHASPPAVREPVATLEPIVPGPVSGAATGEVVILSSAAYLYDSGGSNPGVAVLGEVENRSGERRTAITVRAQLTAGTEVVGSVEGSVVLDRLAWGSRSPFLIDVPAPPFDASDIDGFGVAVLSEGGASVSAPQGLLEVQRGPTTVDGIAEIRWFSGTVRNTLAVPVTAPDVTIATFTGGGAVIDVGTAALAPSVIPAGGTAAYLVPLYYDPAVPVARSTVTVEGFTAAGGYVPAIDNYFDDVGLSAFRPDILWIADQGITFGCGPGRYCPGQSVSRGQMASFLARAMQLPGSAPDAFTDDEDSVHEADINIIAAAGVTQGCGAQLFCPAAPVPRDQMATFLARASGLSGLGPNAFTDDDGNVHEYHINLVARDGIATGCAPGRYCPAGLVTRAEMAAFLRRAFD